jgi:hypothetical protein
VTAAREPDRQEEILESATGLITSAAKWLIGSLGAIGAVLIAGSQLSSIGNLPLGPRFGVAVAGLAVGLSAVMWAVWRVVGLLAPERYTITQLCTEWKKSRAVKNEGVSGRLQRHRYPVVDWLARNPEYLFGHASPVELLEHWQDRSASDRDAALAAINRMLARANYLRGHTKFVRTRRPLAVAIMLAAIGISMFAWAANPGENPGPTLRNADLRNVDLSGASLRRADLTGADLRNADLTGADLTGAIVDDVTWGNTMCPDGVNSDDTAREGRNGASAFGSCAGHLAP